MKRISCEMANELALCSDEYLLSSAKLGEHTAFMELSGRSMPKLLRVLTRITRNSEDAEDASQEALMKAFTHLKTFDGRSSFSTWLTRIAINNALMTLRKKRKRSEVSLDADMENEDAPCKQYADLAPGPESICLQNERRRHLRDAIKRLSPVLRKSIEIRHATDSSIQEVAFSTGVSTAAAKSRLSRAQKDLARFLSARNRRGDAVNDTAIAHGVRRITPMDQ
jgi:RNA polymerase sigma factor (sigma-70 family)